LGLLQITETLNVQITNSRKTALRDAMILELFGSAGLCRDRKTESKRE
jgi:hypothetical protein